jgi:hypothetical protein
MTASVTPVRRAGGFERDVAHAPPGNVLPGAQVEGTGSDG